MNGILWNEEFEKVTKVREYIKNSWIKAVKDKATREDFPLPFDYIPPCIDGSLTDLYYWDTYFTNKGLYIDGLREYAYNNIQNLKYCLNKFGCVPNMCTIDGADLCSQPPLLCLMVDDYYEQTKDLLFLADSYQALEKEYSFWMTKRICENGLNRYGTHYDFSEQGQEHIDYFTDRLGIDVSGWTRGQIAELCENLVAEAESGEDFTPRFLHQAKYINPIDLNCYLYAFEKCMAKFSTILGQGKEEEWETLAQKRAERMKKYCYDEKTGIFFDYNYQTNTRGNVIAVACYLPFVFGIYQDKRALASINEQLICDNGVASCQEIMGEEEKFQWGYPNCWAPHQYWAYIANQKANNFEKAKEIARKYLLNLANEFDKSGKLFEKYDAVKGGKAVVNEYGCPEMLGWTAGVFAVLFSETGV